MKSLPLTPLLFLSALTLAPFISAEDAKTYTLKLVRPDVKGDKFEVEVTAAVTTHQKISQEGTPAREVNEVGRGTLSGTEEILEVSDEGNVRKLQIAVKTFTMKDASEADLLTPGQVVIGEKGVQKVRFTSNGEPVKPKVGKLLEAMFPLTDRMFKSSEDKAFGMDQPRASGTEWELSMKDFISAMPSQVAAQYEEKGSVGKVKFEKIETMEGTEVGVISSSILLKKGETKGLPPQTKIKKSTIEITMKSLLPLDEKKPILGEETITKMSLQGSGLAPTGGRGEFQIDLEGYKNMRRKPVQ